MEVSTQTPSYGILAGVLAREGEMGAESDGKTRSEFALKTTITMISPVITQPNHTGFYYTGTGTPWCVFSLVSKVTLNTPCATLRQCFTDYSHSGLNPRRGTAAGASPKRLDLPSSVTQGCPSFLFLAHTFKLADTFFSQMEAKIVSHCTIYPVVHWLDMKTKASKEYWSNLCKVKHNKEKRLHEHNLKAISRD